MQRRRVEVKPRHSPTPVNLSTFARQQRLRTAPANDPNRRPDRNTANCTGNSPCPITAFERIVAMKSVTAALLVCAALSVAVVNGTMVQDCNTGADSQDPNRVSVSECDVPPCRLRRKHDVIVEAKFKTDKEIKTLRNSVTAQILGLPLPFIGVDGTSACPNIFAEDGSKVGCPLQADTNYVYKNTFKVLDIYPKIKTTVSWALTDGSDGSKPLCFNVKVRITG